MSSEQENPAKRVVSRPIIKRRLQPRSSVGDAPIAKPTHPNIKEVVRPRTAAAPPKKRGELSHGPSATHELDKKNVNASLLAHRRELLAISDDDYEQLEEELVEVAKRSAPAWLISLGVHTSILVVLGLLMLPGLLDPPLQIEVVYAEKLGEQTEDEIFQSPTEEMPVLEDPVLAEDEIEVEDPLASPPEVEPIEFQATNQTSDLKAPSIGMALDGREKGMKKLGRQYLINCLYTRLGEKFKVWVDERVNKRH